MMFKTVAILALSATTLAHPGKRHIHSHHHKWGAGTGGMAAPTGGAFPENGTESGGHGGHGGAFGAGSSSGAPAPAITQTVVPIAASSAVQPGASSVQTGNGLAAVPASSPAAGGQFYGAAGAVGNAASSSCSSTMTSTYTAMQYITMTIPSGTTTASAGGGNSQVLQQSYGQASQAPPVTTSSVASVAPAGFFQKSSYAGGFGTSPAAGGFGSSASAMTTFATSFAPSSAAGSPPAASSSSAPVSSGGKKGLSYNSAALTSAFANTGMSWAYNWGSSQAGTLPSGVSFVPMLWGLNSVGSWKADAATAIANGAPAVLSFNEPDMTTQANLDPHTAAQNHIQYMNGLSVPVGSPAVTNGAGTNPLMGIDWLNAFFSACQSLGGCKVDFVAFHWYSDASQTAYFKQHVTDVINAAAANGVSKVWLTEFGTTGGDTATFLQEVMPFLESTAAVEKYSFFMCAAPQTLSGTTLNSVGQVYASTA